MSRSFFVGLIWGLVVCAAGLAVLSQLAPVTEPSDVAVVTQVAEEPDVQDPASDGSGDAEVQAAPAAPASAEIDLSKTEAETGGAEPAEQDPMSAPEPDVPDPTLADGAASAADSLQDAAEADLGTAKPAEPLAETGDLAPGAASPDNQAATPGTESAPDLPTANPEAPAAPEADAAPLADAGTMPAPKQDKLLEPPSAPETPGAEPAPSVPAGEAAQELPEVVTLPDPTAPEAATEPATDGAALVELGNATLPPTPGLDGEAAGVTTNRLPRIGDAPATDGGGSTEPATEVATSGVAPSDARPIAAYARAFEPEAGKPLFAILLQDIGAQGMARAELASLPFAVTFVIDPAAPDAAEAMSAYRAAGQEVVIRAVLPSNATPGDLEQSFQALAIGLPETVAMMDVPEGGLQEDRVLATQAIPILKAQGRGIVTYDRGLGAADQVARREGLATAMIFRDLDAQGEDTPLIRRYLDRAAFKAAQEGQVVVVGQTRPETVAAILEWLVEGRGATVALAPLTAVMQGGE